MSDVFGKLLAEWDSAGHAVKGAAEEAAEDVSSWFRREHPYPDASQAPAAMPVNLRTATTLEDPMSLLDTIKNGVAEAEAKLEGVDEEALALLKSVTASPEAAVVLKDLGGLASIVGIPEGAITGVAAGLKTLLSLYAQPAAPAPQPAPDPAPAQ